MRTRPQHLVLLVTVGLGLCVAALASAAPDPLPADSLVALRGSITGEGASVPGANVFLLETLEGVLAGDDGRFALPTRHRGPATLVVRTMGYRERRLPVVLPRHEPIAIALEVNAVEMAPTVVRPSTFIAGDDPDVSLTNLDVVRTPGAAADVFRALQTFPGVQPVDEGAGLFVRGGDVTETRIYLNDTVVLAPYKNESPTGGAFGVFDPFLLDGIFFSSGGFGARYGDALSGVAALRTLGRPGVREAGLSASLAALSGRGGVPLKNGWGARATATRSHTGLLFDLNGTTREYTHDPEGRDFSASLMWNYRPTGEIKLFGLDQETRMGVRIDEPAFSGAFEAEAQNDLVALSWRDQLGATRPSLSLGTSGSSREQAYGAFALATDERFEQARARLEWDVRERLTLSVGGDVERRRSDYAGTLPDHGYDSSPDAGRTTVRSAVGAHRHGLYGEADWLALDRLRVTAGLRSDRSTLTSDRTVDPRAAAAFRAGPTLMITAAWGIYHQVPAPFLFEPTRGDPDLGPMEARHWIVGAQVERPDLSLRVEGYDKAYGDLAQVTRDRDVVRGGTGTSRGLDVFLRWRGWSWLQGRVSYSYLHARRTDPNSGQLARSPYDIAHSMSAIVDRQWTPRWRTSLAVRLASGRPFTPVVDAAFDSTQGVWVPEHGSPASERLPAYRRVDLSTSYMRSLWPGNRTIFFLAVNNVLDRDNLFGYRYSPDYSERLPLRSQFKRSIYFGASFLL